MEKQIILYMHGGSGNHGCEAIVNSLCHMVKAPVSLLSNDAREDGRYTLSGMCELIQERKFESHPIMHVLYYLYRKLTGNRESFLRYRYRPALQKKPFLAVSIGGDTYCYDTMINDLILSHTMFREAGVTTVLLGCSIDEERFEDRRIVEDLRQYHTIIARESLTYSLLEKKLQEEGGKGMPRLFLFPDPAFTLQKKDVELPEGFREGNTIGINISPMIMENEEKEGITLDSYCALLEHIIENTDRQIALIPHVVWERNDDRKPLSLLYERFKHSGRVVMIEDQDCERLKGYISRLSLFIGARTHAAIAAYSSLVPTLVVGYSIKARGIAIDLFGTEEGYVMPVRSLRKKEDLIHGYTWLQDHEDEIRKKLSAVMPGYCRRASGAGKEVDSLWEELTLRQKI